MNTPTASPSSVGIDPAGSDATSSARNRTTKIVIERVDWPEALQAIAALLWNGPQALFWKGTLAVVAGVDALRAAVTSKDARAKSAQAAELEAERRELAARRSRISQLEQALDVSRRDMKAMDEALKATIRKTKLECEQEMAAYRANLARMGGGSEADPLIRSLELGMDVMASAHQARLADLECAGAEAIQARQWIHDARWREYQSELAASAELAAAFNAKLKHYTQAARR
jgi:hypothetical protein